MVKERDNDGKFTQYITGASLKKQSKKGFVNTEGKYIRNF